MPQRNLVPVPQINTRSHYLQKALEFVHANAKPTISTKEGYANFSYEGFGIIFRGDATGALKNTISLTGHGVSLSVWLGWKDKFLVEVKESTDPGIHPGTMQEQALLKHLQSAQLRATLGKIFAAVYDMPAPAEAKAKAEV